MVVGFVALTATASAFAHFYTMQEGYALKARKQLDRTQEGNSGDTPARKPITAGGVWGNMAKQRDAIAAAKK
mgnify:CR=1 FL=1